MDEKVMATVFKKAASIASLVPESMQEAAFLRAVDELQGSQSTRGGGRRKSSEPPDDTSTSKPEQQVDPVKALSRLERSKAPEVDAQDSVLGKSLALLLVAEREFGIERLTVQQMGAVLNDKFRWKVSNRGVAVALDRAGNKVDRRQDGKSYGYRLMSSGESWLKSNQTEGVGSVAVRRNAKPKPKKASSPPTKRITATKKPSTKRARQQLAAASGTAKEARPRGRIGPKAAIEQMIDDGFLFRPKTISEIREELQHSRALTFKITDLSPALTRLIREKGLSRTRNDDGQYEYVQSKA